MCSILFHQPVNSHWLSHQCFLTVNMNQPMDASAFTILNCICSWSNIKPEAFNLGQMSSSQTFIARKMLTWLGENHGENHPFTRCFHRFSMGFPRRCRHDTGDARSICTLCTSHDGSSTVMEKSCTPPPGLAVPAAGAQVTGEIARELGKRRWCGYGSLEALTKKEK